MNSIDLNNAEKRMKQRGSEEWEMEHLVKSPSYVKKTVEGRREARGEIRNRKVKIVFMKEEKYIKIITVI